MLRVDINLVFTIINLLVLYLLMKKFLFGPVVAVMEKRKAMIEEQFANAAASIITTRKGALRVMPEEKEIAGLLG